MKFKELPIGVPCGIKGGRLVFCRFAPGPDFDLTVFVMEAGTLADIYELGGEACLERDDYEIMNPYGEIETDLSET